ncbi:MAG: ARMT1-like domain-containing protein, partial [Clostridia bacterium]|nr:ARMT1-like domain-containing protein [Clostridia bacterium]
MQLHEECKDCLLKSQLKKIESSHADNADGVQQFKEEVQKLVDNAPESSCAPLLMRDINGLSRKIFGCDIDYSAEKALFNGKLLALEEQLYKEITAAPDPIGEALKFTMAANYIDFARLSDLNEEAIEHVLSAARRAEPQKDALDKLKEKLQTAKTLLFLHDNCGEIVLDKILIRVIKANYPQISVTSVVRGAPIINDVTGQDAKAVNLPAVAKVINNGTDIPGTYLKEINSKTHKALKTSDVIISKGLGNLETLYGEGYEIFYSFTCKCGHIATRFNAPLWSAAFIYEDGDKEGESDKRNKEFPEEEERSGCDIIVESLSPNTHIHHMGRFIPKKLAAYILAALYLVCGVLC